MKKKIFYIALFIITLLTILTLTQYHRNIPIEELKIKYSNEESQFIKLNGQLIHYRVEGNGFPVVLIHGTASSLHTWNIWTDTLKKKYKVIRMDLPGYGLTGPSIKRDYSIDAYVMFLHTLLDKLQIKSCHMAGNSLGGRIAWNYTVAHPERISKLILIDSSGYPRENKIWALRLAKTPLINNLLKHITPKFLIERNLKQVYGEKTRITEDIIDRYFHMLLREGNRNALVDRAKLEYKDRSHLIKTIQIPVLIMWGAEDKWIPLKYAYAFQKDLPASHLIIYKGAGHVPMEEIPEKTVKDAAHFLEF